MEKAHALVRPKMNFIGTKWGAAGLKKGVREWWETIVSVLLLEWKKV